jgi:hypothetical protein
MRKNLPYNTVELKSCHTIKSFYRALIINGILALCIANYSIVSQKKTKGTEKVICILGKIYHMQVVTYYYIGMQ